MVSSISIFYTPYILPSILLRPHAFFDGLFKDLRLLFGKAMENLIYNSVTVEVQQVSTPHRPDSDKMSGQKARRQTGQSFKSHQKA